jgi:nucleotidyltransferase substrate binding protein (TIGR01987 family)
MMSNLDIRWQQRFNHYQKALRQLERSVELSSQRPLSELEKQGLIKAFEFTHELAWNVMKDYFEYQGTTSIMGSRDAVREAFQRGMVSNGEGWMEMIQSRNQTSHTYNQKVADEIVEKVTARYCELFLGLEKELLKLKERG